MFYNEGSKRGKQEKSNVLTKQCLSVRPILNNEDRGSGKVPAAEDEVNIIESNYNEYSRSIFASDNSYLRIRNHQQEKCSRKRLRNSTQNTENAPANSATIYNKLSNSTTNAQSKICSTLLKNVFVLFVLQTICNRLVTNVICDEKLGYLDSNGHYTHTWVVHIPGGDTLAEDVASAHGMILKGKVRNKKITYFSCSNTSVYCHKPQIKLQRAFHA